MTARIIDGKVIAAELRARVASEVARVRRDHRLTPGLAVVLVGNDPASEVYVRSKHKQTQAAGMASFEHVLPADVAQNVLLALIARLNRDPAVHGILVQLPLPKSLDTEIIVNAVDPAKDVDGLHPNNAGRLAGGFAALSPCTPLGCIMLNKNATVTIAHSRSRELAQLCARADLVYAAVGKPEMVRGDWIKPGATVVDVGINRLPGADGKTRLVGDVAFAEVSNVAGAITPVPGGVGQMTVACLLVNTLRAACAIHGLPKPGV